MIERVIANYNNSACNLTFYSSQSTAAKVKIAEVEAKKCSEGFAGFLEWLDPTRVSLKITDTHTRRVSVKVHHLAKVLGVSPLRIFLARINPFSSLESTIDSALKKHKFADKVVWTLASNYAISHPDEKEFKVSRKKNPYLKNSYLVDKTAHGPLNIYRFNKSYNAYAGRYRNKVVGKGGFKTVKELTDISAMKKMAIALPTKGDSKKFHDEVQLYEKLKSIPNIAQGRRITWINGKNVEKTGILMPLYSGTMDSAKSQITAPSIKNRCSWHVAKAIKSLFDHGLFHLDIKPENIFIEWEAYGKAHAYLGDLGGIREFTAWYSDLWDAGKSFIGFKTKGKNNILQNGLEYTPYFAAPELGSNIYSKEGLQKAVIYSFGKTLQEWYSGTPISSKIKTMVLSAASKDPQNRPSIETIINTLAQEC